MSDKTVAQKLLLRPDHLFVLLNAPHGYLDTIGALPSDVRVVRQATGPADVIQVFITSQREFEASIPSLKLALKPKGILWITYPKGTSPMASDINRDTIWRYARTVGMDAVAMFAVDKDWSALRLKVAGHVGRRTLSEDPV